MVHIGIDFGTTNTAIGVATRSDPPRLVSFPGPDGAPAPTWRTVLYFEPVVGVREDGVSAGGPAIRRYMDNEGEGRLIQSIKSYLASPLFSATQIVGRTWSLEQLIATFLACARREADIDLGPRAVVGRPVRYWGAEVAEDDERAVKRMRDALRLAGFEQVVFEYEPIAAASAYAARLDHDELVLIADFGGGTSDFSLIRVGPRLEPGDPRAILATGGLGVGGDTFDGRIVDRVIAPLLGRGTTFRDEFGSPMPVPQWLYSRLRRWHHLSFLKTPENLALLHRVLDGADDRPRIANLVAVIEDDLGLPMHQAIEATKVELSRAQDATLRFVRSPLALVAAMSRGDFDQWIEAELAEIDRSIEEMLARASVPASAVDRVFATGGSSLVPAVRARLGARFGADRVVGGDELTSVAWGLAAGARAAFAD